MQDRLPIVILRDVASIGIPAVMPLESLSFTLIPYIIRIYLPVVILSDVASIGIPAAVSVRLRRRAPLVRAVLKLAMAPEEDVDIELLEGSSSKLIMILPRKQLCNDNQNSNPHGVTKVMINSRIENTI